MLRGMSPRKITRWYVVLSYAVAGRGTCLMVLQDIAPEDHALLDALAPEDAVGENAGKTLADVIFSKLAGGSGTAGKIVEEDNGKLVFHTHGCHLTFIGRSKDPFENLHPKLIEVYTRLVRKRMSSVILNRRSGLALPCGDTRMASFLESSRSFLPNHNGESASF